MRRARCLLWFLAVERFGGILAAANALELDYKTLTKALNGSRVSSETQMKIEKSFGYRLEILQRPLREILEGLE